MCSVGRGGAEEEEEEERTTQQQYTEEEIEEEIHSCIDKEKFITFCHFGDGAKNFRCVTCNNKRLISDVELSVLCGYEDCSWYVDSVVKKHMLDKHFQVFGLGLDPEKSAMEKIDLSFDAFTATNPRLDINDVRIDKSWATKYQNYKKRKKKKLVSS